MTIGSQTSVRRRIKNERIQSSIIFKHQGSLGRNKGLSRKYRLVISDVMMKQINGPIFANKIKEINREMKVILISGFDYKTMDLSHGRYDKFIQIPVTLWELFSAVNEVLEIPPSVENELGYLNE